MKRLALLRSVPALLALTLFAAACSGSPADAARINSDSISKSDLHDEVDALVAAIDNIPDSDLDAVGRAELKASLMDKDGKSPSSQFAADILTNKVVGVFVSQGMERFGLSIEDSDREAATAETATQIYNFTNDSLREANIEGRAASSRLFRYLADPANVWYDDADIEAYYELKKDTTLSVATACTAHILVDDKSVAENLMKQLQDGADFAALAAMYSTDESNRDNGGDLGCNAEGAFVPEFEDAVKAAKAGDLVGPVETQFGFHVIRVDTAYEVGGLDDAMRARIADLLSQPRGWLDLAISQGSVAIDRQFGTWDPEQIRVIPPTGATLSPSGS